MRSRKHLLPDSMPEASSPHMPPARPQPRSGWRTRLVVLCCLAVATALALFVPSDSLRATLFTVLVVLGLMYAGWRLSVADEERAEPLPADD